MKTIRAIVNLAGAATLLALAACAEEEPVLAGVGAETTTYAIGGDRTIDVGDGFVRPAEAGAISTAGYLSLTASAPAAIVGARAEGFAGVELHDVQMDGAVMRMRLIDRIALTPGEVTALAPGERHLMMMSPTGPLDVGDQVIVTLLFEDGSEADVTLPVQRR